MMRSRRRSGFSACNAIREDRVGAPRTPRRRARRRDRGAAVLLAAKPTSWIARLIFYMVIVVVIGSVSVPLNPIRTGFALYGAHCADHHIHAFLGGVAGAFHERAENYSGSGPRT